MNVKVTIVSLLIMVILAWSVNRVLISMNSVRKSGPEESVTSLGKQPNNMQITNSESINNKLWIAIERKESYNNELQYYSKENVTINDNELIIISKKEEKENKSYTSGLIESTYAYLYGNFEFDIQVSEGKGIFPAIWLMPADNTSLPEIDIFEMIGSDPQNFWGVLHYVDDNGLNQRSYFEKEVNKKDTYKVALSWSENELAWYIDGELVNKSVNAVPDKYMYIIINQAIGGNWPGDPDDKTKFPASFIVKDYKIIPINEKRRY